MKQTAGTLLFKEVGGSIEILLVHPSGNYNKRSPWGIPKGLPDEGEELEAAARRETLEETGIVCGDLELLGHIDYTKSRKRVFCFVGKAPLDQEPTCASWEIDKAEFFTFDRANEIMHADQRRLLDQFQLYLAAR
ncbi:MAG: NUDIX domain-containing protein [Candidatus Melainabacteria bacterium]|nr:NUDIX domain-containing protein [Candidatus Melainabacteria bacterium]